MKPFIHVISTRRNFFIGSKIKLFFFGHKIGTVNFHCKEILSLAHQVREKLKSSENKF